MSVESYEFQSGSESDQTAAFQQALDSRYKSDDVETSAASDDVHDVPTLENDLANDGADGFEQATDVTPETTAAEWLSPALTGLADAFGITADEAREFGSQNALHAAISMIRRRESAGNSAPATLAATPAATQTEQQILQALSEEDFDPNIAKFSKDIVAEINELRQLKQHIPQLLQMQQHFQNQEASQRTNWLDQQFQALGQDYETLFGKGNVNQIKQNQTHFDARDRVARTWGNLSQSYPDVPKEKLFERAVAAEFLDEVKTIIKKQSDSALRAQSRNRIGSGSRPSRPLAAAKGTDSRAALIEAWQQMQESN